MSAKTLSKSEISLHWIVGGGMIILTGVGIYMSDNDVYSLYPTHKSIGTILFAFILARVILRMRNGWPESVNEHATREKKLARLIHWILILSTLAMPLSGMVDTVMAGRGLSIFGLELVPSNLNIEGRPTAINADLSNFASVVHEIVGKVLIAAILLHIVGALKHHVFDGDRTLRRMLGRI